MGLKLIKLNRVRGSNMGLYLKQLINVRVQLMSNQRNGLYLNWLKTKMVFLTKKEFKYEIHK